MQLIERVLKDRFDIERILKDDFDILMRNKDQSRRTKLQYNKKSVRRQMSSVVMLFGILMWKVLEGDSFVIVRKYEVMWR